MSDYKNKSIDSFNEQATDYNIDSNGYPGLNLYPLLIEKLNTLSFNSILDVSCGTGTVLSLLLAKNQDIKAYGLDSSEDMINMAEKKLTNNATLSIGDSEHIPYDNGSFDVVICTHSFHHYANPSKVLNEMYRVLKKNGTLIICDYYQYFPPFRQLMNFFIKFSKDRDIRIYSQKEIFNLFDENNFRDHRWYIINKKTYMAVTIK